MKGALIEMTSDSLQIPYRLVTFPQEGRMTITRFIDRSSLMRALRDAEQAGRPALALEVLAKAFGGDEGGKIVTGRRRRR